MPLAHAETNSPTSGVVAPSAEPAVNSALTIAEIKAVLARGDDAFRKGDLTSARLYYLRAFAVGDGRGALGIGASYDRFFLRRFHLWTERADPAEARLWYLRAHNLGTPEAETRLSKLDAESAR
jgi:hypothetical protein